MRLSVETIREIKHRVLEADPQATIILYGSFARGDGKPESDIDLINLGG